MTERIAPTRRTFLGSGLLGALGLGLAAGGMAEQHNVRGVDRELEIITKNFHDFMDIILSRTELDSVFPGGIQRLAHDDEEMRFLFSHRTINNATGTHGKRYQLLVPSEDISSQRISAAVTVSSVTVMSEKTGLPDTDRLTIGAFFAPFKANQTIEADDGGSIIVPSANDQQFRLFNFDNFELPSNTTLSIGQLTELPSQVIKGGLFSNEQDWTIYNDESSHVAGEVFKAEACTRFDKDTVGIVAESSGYLEYTEVIDLR